MTYDNDYKVGFCKPPVHTRFKPGQSGNPKGRPKGSMDTLRLIDKIVSKKVTATIDGRPLKISKRQAMLLRMANEATQGNLNTFKTILPLLMQIDARKAAHAAAAAGAISHTDREILDEYLHKKGGNV